MIVAPAGAPASRDHTIEFAGTSESVAVAVNVSAVSSLTVLSPGSATAGAAFTSFTVTAIPSKSLSAGVPLSVARIVIGKALEGPCASVGVHEKAPVEALMVAPGGPASIEKVMALAGRSVSVAVAVKARVASSFTVLLPIAASAGATFTSLTVTVMVSVSLSGALPLSVTRNVMG